MRVCVYVWACISKGCVFLLTTLVRRLSSESHSPSELALALVCASLRESWCLKWKFWASMPVMKWLVSVVNPGWWSLYISPHSLFFFFLHCIMLHFNAHTHKHTQTAGSPRKQTASFKWPQKQNCCRVINETNKHWLFLSCSPLTQHKGSHVFPSLHINLGQSWCRLFFFRLIVIL